MIDSAWQKQNTAFLAAGSDPFGLLPDAWPLALDGCMAACSGFLPLNRREPVLLTAPGAGPAGVASDLFPMLPPDTAAEAVIQSTLGPCLSDKEYPAACFCAMLAEIVTFNRLEAHREQLRMQELNGVNSSIQSAAQELTDEIKAALEGFRAYTMQNPDDALPGRPQRPEACEVSVGACCLTRSAENGHFILDVFCAGDYSIYLWDEDGLTRIYTDRAKPLSPDGDSVLSCRRIRFEEHRTFGVVLLSGSPSSLRSHGRTGHDRSLFDRLYLEQRLLRIMQDAVSCSDVSARAIRMLGSPAAGQDSVSGGLLLPSVGGSDCSIPDDFRIMCRDRSARLEEILWLLTDKAADTAPAAGSCTDAERAFVRDLFRRTPGLADKVSERLTARISAFLDNPAAPDADEQGGIPAEGCDPLRRLTRADVLSVFRRYDSENDSDRERITKNRIVIRSVLSEHWMTLRPVLCVPGSPIVDITSAAAEASADARAEACALLARRIAEQQAVIAHLTPLTEAMTAADEWVDRTTARFSALPPLMGGFSLPACVTQTTAARRLLQDRLDTARDRMNSLFTAYTHERDCLFRFDTEPADGQNACLRTAYAAMMHGRLPAASWQWCLDAVRACPETRGFENLFRALPVISADIAALERAIDKRSVRSRCIRNLSEQADRMFDCFRAAVFQDTAWGSDIGSLVSADVRRDYLAVIRRHREEIRLAARRAEVYESCLTAAARFGDLQD